MASPLKLSRREIRSFIHNAQLAVVELVDDDRIPAVFYYKNALVQQFQGSKFSAVELAAVLISAAWDIFNTGDKGAATEDTQR